MSTVSHTFSPSTGRRRLRRTLTVSIALIIGMLVATVSGVATAEVTVAETTAETNNPAGGSAAPSPVAPPVTAPTPVPEADGSASSERPNPFDSYELAPYIYGGWQATFDDWSELAMVVMQVGSSYEFFCAGSLIREDIVLTAAHCAEAEDFHLNPTGLFVVTGQSSLSSLNRELIPVSAVSLPPGRNPNRGEFHDLALLHLETPSITGEVVSFATPGRQPNLNRFPLMVTAGWGETEYEYTSNDLREVVVDVRPPSECAGLYYDFEPGNELCLGGIGAGACSGDSGGSVYGIEEHSNLLLLTAVISRGVTEPCGWYPFIATTVAPYADWIYSSGTVAGAQRIKGSNRYGTAANLALETVEALHLSDPVTVFIANGDEFPDALSASAAAGASQAVILLTEAHSLPGETIAALNQLQLERIIVVGGDNAVAPTVVNQIANVTGIVPMRWSGGDRYVTSAVISANTFSPNVEFAFVAVGTAFPDALVAAPMAGQLGIPVLLTEKGSLPEKIYDELLRLRPKNIMIFGGRSAVSDNVMAKLQTIAPTDRIAGKNREDTAIQLSQVYDPGVDVVYVSTGYAFPDALAAGPLAAVEPGPILLLGTEPLSNQVFAEVLRLRPARIVALGGDKAVDPSVLFHLSVILKHWR